MNYVFQNLETFFARILLSSTNPNSTWEENEKEIFHVFFTHHKTFPDFSPTMIKESSISFLKSSSSTSKVKSSKLYVCRRGGGTAVGRTFSSGSAQKMLE